MIDKKETQQEVTDILSGRKPLRDSIQLLGENGSPHTFLIEEVMNAGGSCICYKARRCTNDGRFILGTLKEFYPVDLARKEDGEREEAACEVEPRCAFSLDRETGEGGTHANQLRTRTAAEDNFYKAREDFLITYKVTVDEVRKLPQTEHFITPYQIFKGVAPEHDPNNFTYYIWTEGENTLVSFEDYLTDLRKAVRRSIRESDNTSRTLAYYFHTVLKVIRSLATGIKALHTQNLLHLDIKPANFGIRMRDGRALTETISMFDLNAIYRATDALCRFAGTDGFRAPEMTVPGSVTPTRACDLYSLGATLYYAVVFNETTEEEEETEADRPDRLYRDPLFDEIDSRIAESALFRWSEINAQAGVHDRLTDLLKGCLVRGLHTDTHKAFTSVSQFLENLDALIRYLEADMQRANVTEEGMTLVSTAVEREEYWDGAVDTGATGAMQCLLYDYPLYHYAVNGIVDVLVLGCGTYAQRFIDVAFEMSQISNCNLNITVITNRREDEERFLALRPDFTRFFTVNGIPASEEPYGNIRFLTLDEEGFLGKTDAEKKRNLDKEKNIEKIISVLGENYTPFSYAFIALGENDFNRRIAQAVAQSDSIMVPKLGSRKRKPLVNYVLYSEPKKTRLAGYKDLPVEMHPVWVQNVLVSHPDYAFLKRIAFNVHLVWNGRVNIDLKKERARFKAAYSFNSSLANVLSLKYKLHSAGIQLDKNKLEATTQKVTELLSGEGKGTCSADELALYEHRRWIVNNVCNGWRGMREDEYCQLFNDTKDKKNRRHPCITVGQAGRILQNPVWKSGEQWDREDLEETVAFRELDALDRMSVLLHRALKSNANKVDLAQINKEASKLKTALTGNPQALAAFSSYYTVLQDILQNPQERIVKNDKTYKHYREKLLLILNADPERKEDAKEHLDKLDKLFKPIRLAAAYTDFKSKDYEIIENIPFILNYSTTLRICIPFEMTHENRFENVASCLLLNPAHVTYIVDLEDIKRDGDLAAQLLDFAVSVMDGHNLQTRIHLVLTAEKCEKAHLEPIAEKLSNLSEDRIVSCTLLTSPRAGQTMQKLREYMHSINSSAIPFTLIERNRTRISGWLDTFRTSAARYSFDSVTKQFEPDKKCAWLRHIPFTEHLNVEDMFASQGCLSVSKEPEMMKSYLYFWENFYRKGSTEEELREHAAAWKKLCTTLKAEAQRIDRLGWLNFEQNKKHPKETAEFFAPAFCKDALEKVFTILRNEPYCLLGEETRIEDFTSVMLKVTLHACTQVTKAVTTILSDPHKLYDAAQITDVQTGNMLTFYGNSLCMKDVVMPFMPFANEPKDKRDKASPESLLIRDFLYKMKEDGYLLNFSHRHADANCTNDLVSFTFCSQSVKDLLTNEGNLLELYIYYELLKSGHYDDIRTGIQVHRMKGGVSVPTHELDIVTVKGMCTQLCEIKARTDLDAQFYSKLYACAKTFGINTETVLIADLLGKVTGDNYANTVYMQRGGEDFAVRTVYRTEDIASIGKVMRRKTEKK